MHHPLDDSAVVLFVAPSLAQLPAPALVRYAAAAPVQAQLPQRSAMRSSLARFPRSNTEVVSS
ncbi:hypothetical protein GGR77_004563 [Xanthomonas translucens]